MPPPLEAFLHCSYALFLIWYTSTLLRWSSQVYQYINICYTSTLRRCLKKIQELTSLLLWYYLSPYVFPHKIRTFICNSKTIHTPKINYTYIQVTWIQLYSIKLSISINAIYTDSHLSPYTSSYMIYTQLSLYLLTRKLAHTWSTYLIFPSNSLYNINKLWGFTYLPICLYIYLSVCLSMWL